MPRTPKIEHEVRDAIHGFVRFNNLERALMDTAPMQRLKQIHQLAMTYQVYPGATHRRFEHSLGVMELAGQAFDSLLRDENREYGANQFPEVRDRGQREHWRQLLRVAALLHDIGHLPFSHAAESQVLPDDSSHETLTCSLIGAEPISSVLDKAHPTCKPEHVIRLALEPEKQPETVLTPWEALLNSLITGGTFGVDRIDYLLRDSHHAGVPYGRFDPLRLIDNLVILQSPAPEDPIPVGGETSPPPEGDADPGEAILASTKGDAANVPASGNPERWCIGVQHGGLHGVEALLMARYWMYKQLYFHDVRRAFDLHLIEFMETLYPNHSYPTTPRDHLCQTDDGVMVKLLAAAGDSAAPGHEPARRICKRDHYRTACVFKRSDVTAADSPRGPEWPSRLAQQLRDEFGSNVEVDYRPPRLKRDEVFVLMDDGEVVSGLAESDVLGKIPDPWYGYVFCPADLVERVAALAG